jgi:1-acyl-sn-glycerol-3-phosphate acyltransferase
MKLACSQVRPGSIDAYSEAFAHRFMRVLDWTAEKLKVDVVGLENLPKGRALLVTNHAFGFDAGLLMARIEAASGRRVWVLGEHAWWVIPGLRRIAAAVGTVDGTPENADRLLSSDELVLVMPGGAREALKPRELRYRLLWGHRYGFVRAALRNEAPIVPIASLGPEEIFDLVGNPWRRSRRLHLPFPLPRPAHLLPIPHRAPIQYVIGEPIPVDRCRGSDEEATVRRLRREVEGALHEIFEERLASRVGFPTSAPPPNGPPSA